MREDLPKDDIRNKLAEYFKVSPYPVALAYLFGSAARGQTTPLSDLDIGVYLDESDREKRWAVYLPLLADLSRVLGREDIDLLYLNDCPPLWGYRVISGDLIYCAGEQQRIRVESGILGSYFDERDLQRARHRLLRRRILAGKVGEGSPEMIDRQAVEDRLAYIEAMVRRLRSYRPLSFQEFQGNEGTYHAALYEIQTCLEAVTDIGNHLVAAMGLGKPEHRSDILRLLAREGIIGQPLMERLIQALQMRNIIVHGYLRVVAWPIYQVIQQDLGDLEEFAQCILNYLAQVQPEGNDG